MEVVDHPYLEGVKCREDGAVFLPQSGVKKAHWTFGHRMDDGYMRIRWKYEDFRVHRLICEAFHGTCPPDKTEVDHIDRNPANNKPENLRWCSRSENSRNRAIYAKCGVSSTRDRTAYNRARLQLKSP